MLLLIYGITELMQVSDIDQATVRFARVVTVVVVPALAEREQPPSARP